MTQERDQPTTAGARPGTGGWALVFVATALTTVAAGSLLLLLPPALERRGLSEGPIGLILAAGGVVSFLTRVPAGIAYRRRRSGLVIAAAGVVTTASFLLIPLAGAPVLLAILVGINGGAFALASTTAMAAVVDNRPPSMSLASLMGWFTGSIGAGYSIAGFVSGALADAIGITSALRAMAIVPLAAAGLMVVALVRVASVPGESVGEDHGASADPPASPRDWLRSMPAGLWTAFAVALYINLVNGALHAFFPIYGLAIGLTLTQVGLISGIHGSLASVVRFGAGPLFRRVGFGRVISLLVTLSATFVMLLWFPRSFVPIAGTFAVIGIARGVLRVASGAMAVEGSTSREHGGASGIYLAGLDLGNVLGPLLGGATAELVGLRTAFPVLGAIFFLSYLLLVRVFSATRLRRSASA